MSSTLVLLPGLDGTGRLFERFVRAAPAGASVLPLALPPDRVLSYDQLADFVQGILPPGPLVVLGESFSGPLALRLAGRVPLAAVILCASFIRPPLALWAAAEALSLLMRVAPPVSVVRTLLAGGDMALARDLVSAVGEVDREVLASRVRMVLRVNLIAELAACSVPIQYLRAARDRVVGPRQAALVRKARPDADVAIIDGPHLLLQALAKECWTHINAFSAR